MSTIPTQHAARPAPPRPRPALPTGPQQKREHLRAFIEQVVGQGRPVVILGTSLGGTIGMDFALHYPHLVHSLVLVDPQVGTE